MSASYFGKFSAKDPVNRAVVMPWMLFLLALWSGADASGLGQGARLTLWTPGRLDALHQALHSGTPMQADLRPMRSARGVAKEGAPAGARLSLWVPHGQQQLAAREWEGDREQSAVLVREADDEDALLNEEASALMSPDWLRTAGRVAGRSLPHEHQEARLDRVRRSLGFFRRKRSASPGPSERSSEDASVATDRKPTPQQAKAARSHQFITTRNEKDQPPVLREVEPTSTPTPEKQSQNDARDRDAPPTAATPASGTSRLGAARDALGVRVNEIPQGPRYSSAYESETLRHASDHRHYMADQYGGHNGYSMQYGGTYGSGGYGGSGYGPRSVAPPASPTATPRRIIYYASLPDPTPQPLPGASRVPHEYRGPPYEINGALAADTRYPSYYDSRSQADNMYRSRFRPGPSVPRYTIIDAEPPGPLSAYRAPGAGPVVGAGAPYRDRGVGGPQPAAFPQPYRLGGSAGASVPDAGPQGASPIQYTNYDYNGIGGLEPHLPSDTMSPSGARTANSAALIEASKPGSLSPLMSEDPYRGFNPRQPAPWSMQVGTRLTVKDDGYGSVGGLPGAARRFYVTSQQQPDLDLLPLTSRIPRPLDRSEARHRLLR